MRLFLGVDGGQSSTLALIGDETGRIAGMGRGGPCNHVAGPGGREKFLGAMHASIGAAAGAAGLPFPGTRFEAACLGFSGGPADKRAVLAELLDTGHLLVTTDALIALAGAIAGEPGVITIAGTGSIACGRNGAGAVARIGGWGYVFGDEGGGFDLTRQALRAGLRFEEGWGPPTSLAAALLDATGAADMNDLLHRFYTLEWPRPRIAALSKLVDRAALAGDAVAREILHASAQQLAQLAGAARGRLFRADELVRVAPIGGVFRSRLLHERFRLLVELAGVDQVIEPIYGPAAGALLEACRSAGLSVSRLAGYRNEKTDS